MDITVRKARNGYVVFAEHFSQGAAAVIANTEEELACEVLNMVREFGSINPYGGGVLTNMPEITEQIKEALKPVSKKKATEVEAKDKAQEAEDKAQEAVELPTEEDFRALMQQTVLELTKKLKDVEAAKAKVREAMGGRKCADVPAKEYSIVMDAFNQLGA